MVVLESKAYQSNSSISVWLIFYLRHPPPLPPFIDTYYWCSKVRYSQYYHLLPLESTGLTPPHFDFRQPPKDSTVHAIDSIKPLILVIFNARLE